MFGIKNIKNFFFITFFKNLSFSKKLIQYIEHSVYTHIYIYLQTAFLSNKDQIHITKSKLLAQMDSAMGGRAAEELIFGPDKITAGAQSDFKVFLVYF